MAKNILEIIERIKILKKVGAEGEVASLLGMTAANLSNYKTRGAIPYEQLSSFCEQERISLDWLLTGEGEMKRGERGERPQMTAEPAIAYNVRDVEIQEIVEFLRESPLDKKLILKMIKGRKMADEALESLKGKRLVEEG